MNFADLVGQTLDGKYKIERQLGRGGMGTVYLATHLGTERPVAVKVIAPQFMERAEFVERFRREARAAGRLRHPNVVNVTDFGFAETSDGRAAYLAMEYLDGCTLGEILEEEHNLPVAWTLDILEQVCSAVHEAHEQGIIHRDLKPDNIWLEPNQRGGYTVKVLDFGIAKLEEHRTGDSSEEIEISVMPNPTQFFSSKTTVADHQHGDTVIHDSVSPTRVFESATMAQTAEASEARTAILPLAAPTDEDPDATGTQLMSDEHDHPDAARPTQVSTSEDLTRVGAVIGTPLYMSPEQCRGERLDARSDIYSLGVIAYQMLAGRTPFEGDFTYVMEAHKLIPPPPLDAKKVRKKLKGVIVSALEKNPDDRPQTAEAFASVLRSRSEGIFGLLRRAGMIYTSYMPKFLILSAFFFIPMIILTASLMTLTVIKAAELLSEPVVYALLSINGISLWVIGTFCAYMIVGTITWIVAQNLAVPLRPVRLRPALREAKRKWKTFAGTSILAAMLPVAACIIAFIPAFAVVFALVGLIAGFGGKAAVAGLVAGILAAIAAFIFVSTRIMLVAAVVMMESKGGWQAIKRAQQLVRRSFATAVAAFLLMFIIPAATAETLSFVVKRTARSIQNDASNIQIVDKNSQPSTDESAAQPQPDAAPAPSDKDHDVTINFGGRAIRVNDDKKEEDGDMSTRVTNALLETLSQLLILPLQIIFTSFTAIISALLYLKTRQSGGEPLKDLLEKFEETEHPRKKWQERVRQRLIQSGRITSRP